MGGTATIVRGERMTRKEIEQIHKLNKEIKMWQKELEKLECKSLIKPIDLTKEIRGTGTSFDDDMVAKADIELIIKGKLTEIQLARARILKYINDVEDSLLRQVMYLRAVSNMKWYQIGQELNITDSCAKMIYFRHFRKL